MTRSGLAVCTTFYLRCHYVGLPPRCLLLWCDGVFVCRPYGHESFGTLREQSYLYMKIVVSLGHNAWYFLIQQEPGFFAVPQIPM